MGAVFAPTRFSLVRISIRDLVADGKYLVRNSGVGGGGENLILILSGKEKAHKHKSFWPVTPPVTGGSPDWEARGQSFMCYPRNPRNISLFVRIPDREDRRPGWPEKVLCRGGPKGVSTKGVSMQRPNFPYFRAFYTVVSKGNFQKSPWSWIPLLWRPFWSFPIMWKSFMCLFFSLFWWSGIGLESA